MQNSFTIYKKTNCVVELSMQISSNGHNILVENKEVNNKFNTLIFHLLMK